MREIGEELQDYFLPFTRHEPEQFERGETEVPALKYVNLSIEARRIRIITQPKDPAGALSGQAVTYGVEVVIVVGQRRDVHQARNLVAVQLDEQAEGGDSGDPALEHVADMAFHEIGLEPFVDVPLGFLGAA